MSTFLRMVQRLKQTIVDESNGRGCIPIKKRKTHAYWQIYISSGLDDAENVVHIDIGTKSIVVIWQIRTFSKIKNG